MSLPAKTRYTVAEAAQRISNATGERVLMSQILDLGSQGLFRLYAPFNRATIQQVGKPDIERITDSIVEIRLSNGQAATLGRGERVSFSTCWRDGIECKFMRHSAGHIPGWRSDTADMRVSGFVVLGSELDAFIASVAAPVQVTAPEAAPVVAGGGTAPLKTIRHSTKTARRDTLTPVIELAQKQCRNPTDTAEVWAALLVLAEKKTGPLIGATEDGLQYLKSGVVAYLNREALDKRLHPEKRGKPGKRR
jgi:hypothetical protein